VLFIAVMAMSWWDPVSWWDTIKGTAVRTFDDIKSFIRHAVHTALHLVTDALDFWTFLQGLFNAAIQWAVGVAQSVANTAMGWIEGAADTVGHWINDAWNWFWSNVIAPAIGAVDAAWRFGVGVVQDIVSGLQAAFDWVNANLIDPMFHWIENAADTVGQWINDAWNWFYQEVIAPIAHLLNDVAAAAQALWDWFWNVAKDAVEGVVRAWDWIVWFGEHTFRDLEHLGADMEQGQGLDALVTVMRDSYDAGAAAMDHLASWLS
jgi:phage-related protein